MWVQYRWDNEPQEAERGHTLPRQVVVLVVPYPIPALYEPPYVLKHAPELPVMIRLAHHG